MISYPEMVIRLQRIGRFYNKTHNVESDKLISKLALVESCGWIEQYIDSETDNYLVARQIIGDKRIAEKIHSVHNMAYKDFLSVVGAVVGHINVVKIEKLYPNEFSRLKSNLDQLHSYRNKLAHESVDSNTNIPSPQIIISRFAEIKKDIDVYFLEINKI